jgi:CheY-like chemotaxis protein
MTIDTTHVEMTAWRLEALPNPRPAQPVRGGGDVGRTSGEPPRPGVHRRRPEPSAPRLPRNLVDVSVLVVDDDETTLDFLAAALSYCGAQVTTAAGAAEALEILKTSRPHVVLSDIAMPGQDGYWLLREIRKLPDPALGSVPVVATTAYGRVHSREKAVAAGFAAHIAKPVDPDVLCRTIAEVVGRVSS